MTLSERWQILNRLALLGTARAEWPAPIAAEFLRLQIDAELPFSEQLLEAAALLGPLVRAATPLPATPTLPPPAAVEALPPIGARAAYHLDLLLGGSYGPALPEWLALARDAGRRVLPRQLPALLQRAEAEADLRPETVSVGGERLRWLATYWPRPLDWLPQTSRLPADTPPSALTPLAVTDLTRWRATDAAAARTALADAWEALEPRQKARLLPALLTGLHTADEPLLERALDDRRKEVRQAAAEVLSYLPDSALQDRLWSWAAAALQYRDGDVLVSYPSPLPKATARDGIYPTGSKTAGGLPASWLAQIVARIDPRRWQTAWGATPTTIVGRLGEQPHTRLLLPALAEALVRFPAPAWEAALCRIWLHLGERTTWDHPAGRVVLARAPAETFNELLLDWLARHGPLVAADTLAATWLTLGRQPWRPALTRILLLGFFDQADRIMYRPWEVAHYRALFQAAAYRSDPAQLEALRQAMPQRAQRWSDEVEQLLQVLHFRREMRAALRES